MPPPSSKRTAALRVFLTSTVLLFAELMVVRWTGAEISRLAFFQNLVLIAALLGAGLGMAAGPRRPRLAWLVLPLLGLFAIGVPLAGRSARIAGLRFGDWTEFHWSSLAASTLLDGSAFLLFFLALFVASLLLFVGLGALVGASLPGLPTLEGYAWNLFGSLAGVAGFAAASYLGLRPAAWLLLLALPLGFSLGRGTRGLGAAAAVAVGGFAVHGLSEPAIWSSYHRLSVSSYTLPTNPPRTAFLIDVNRSYFMSLFDLRQGDGGVPRLVHARRHYGLPYDFIAPSRVLVLGAGGGNDVAAALRAAVPAVDAVEIDPAIIQAGRSVHPERPYDSPKVRVFADDARSFLRRSPDRYDLVVMGLLDSHTLLSGLPGVRLDNYLYTVESLEDVRRHLSPAGVFALSFAVFDEHPWLAVKLQRLIETAFGEAPLVVRDGYDASLTYLVGPGLRTARGEAAAAAIAPLVVRIAATGPVAEVAVPRDDWPHLYLMVRAIPPAQLVLLGLLLAASLAAVRLFAPISGRPDPHFALLGAGFLLVETKGIADLGLLFGGTWWTVTAVIAAVLVMALGSVFAVIAFNPGSRRWCYVGLVAALALSYLVRPADLLALPLPWAQAAGSLLVAAPVFFSGLIFSISLARSGDPAAALGSNLIGAVLGGFLEYASLSWGVRALSLIGIALYALSALALARRGGGAVGASS